MVASLGGLLVVGVFCLPIYAAFAALFLWSACKIVREDRPYLDTFKAALALAGIMALINLPMRFINVPLVTGPLSLVLGGVIGAFLYANVLSMEPGKAFLAWLTQHGMLLAFFLIVCGVPLLLTGGAEQIARRLQNAQVAQAPDAMEHGEPTSGEAGTETSTETADPQPIADPMPQEAMPLEGEPTPEAAPAAEPAAEAPAASNPPPESSPASTPEDASPPERSPESAPLPAPAAAPELKFPPGFQGDAQRAYHAGRIHDGNQFLRAALLTSDEPALWSHVRWCVGLHRPVMGLRWGLGLQMAEPPPVLPSRDSADGVPQPAEGAGNPIVQDNAAAGEQGDKLAPASDDLAELRKITGEFGPKLLAALPKSTIDPLLGPTDSRFQAPLGVQFVGVAADARAVRSLAEQKGVDVVLIAAVTFKVYGANRSMDANLTVRLVDVATDKRLWASKVISSNQARAAANRGQDPTAEMVRSLTDFLEHGFELQDRPEIDAAKARQLADAAAGSEAINPLPALVEVRYYQLKGLLTPLQAELSFQKLLDAENAALMASGNPDQRRKVIERFLPRKQ